MAAADELKLFGRSASPYTIRVRIAFNLKQVTSYEYIDVGFDKKAIIKVNPILKRTPMLVHNGNTIFESMVIVQYIDQVWADNKLAILAKEPYDRASASFWTVYVDEKLPPAIRILLKFEEGDRNQAAQDSTAVLQQLEDAFKQCSKGKDFFSGDSIGYLDIALGSHLGWIKAAEKIGDIRLLDEIVVPLLTNWAARFCSSESVKKVMPEVDELIEFHKVILSTKLTTN